MSKRKSFYGKCDSCVLISLEWILHSLFIIHDELEAEKMNQWIISWNQFFINKVLQASNQKIKFSQITLFLENAFI